MIRRAQKPITIRSDRAHERLRALTRDGRSQAQVVEEALDRMPDVGQAFVDEAAERRDRVYATLRRLAAIGGPGMPEFDAAEYDESGNLR